MWCPNQFALVPVSFCTGRMGDGAAAHAGSRSIARRGVGRRRGATCTVGSLLSCAVTGREPSIGFVIASSWNCTGSMSRLSTMVLDSRSPALGREEDRRRRGRPAGWGRRCGLHRGFGDGWSRLEEDNGSVRFYAGPRIRIGWSVCSCGRDLIQTVGSDWATEIACYPFAERLLLKRPREKKILLRQPHMCRMSCARVLEFMQSPWALLK
jgi:hypothetical protein